jgi:MFS transporter, AAHS family, 4-hydroxybenzoate transporter
MTPVEKDGSLPEDIDVPSYIDGHPVSRFQVRLLLLCAAVVFVDGFDAQAIGYVAPALAKEWGLSRGAMGPIFSAGLVGLMIGALTFSVIADRIGRRQSSC